MSVLDNKKISFIGGGNMAQALISGLVSCGVKPSLIPLLIRAVMRASNWLLKD